MPGSGEGTPTEEGGGGVAVAGIAIGIDGREIDPVALGIREVIDAVADGTVLSLAAVSTKQSAPAPPFRASARPPPDQHVVPGHAHSAFAPALPVMVTTYAEPITFSMLL
ncbi:hypothetical protein KXR53_32705 [Inquilinus limosus]|uniref:hypothetical protein n=1 Tax=Inquilinus limosus TaxID=171674 RepID=UPI003F139D7A